MNISVMVTYFKYLLLAGAMCAFASCQREDLPSEQEGKAIELSATSDWPKFSKAPITDKDDLKGDGFVVWGCRENDNAVFAQYGTKVSAVANAGGNVDSWEYSPVRYWFSGHYMFAALLPANAIALSAGGSGILAEREGSISVSNGGTTYTNSLRLKRALALGGKTASATELAASDQPDLMYAFSNVDNSEHTDAAVNLNFKHLWAQLGFKLTYYDIKKESIVINKVKVYGLGNTLAANTVITDNESSNISSIRTALASAAKSTADAPFATFNLSVTANRGVEVTLVDKLMVFPVNLSDMPVTVEISFKYGNNDMTMKGTINAGEWVSGKRYVYPLEVGANSINFDEPTVTQWVTAPSFKEDIVK